MNSDQIQRSFKMVIKKKRFTLIIQVAYTEVKQLPLVDSLITAGVERRLEIQYSIIELGTPTW